jgi:hypothetical protein
MAGTSASSEPPALAAGPHADAAGFEPVALGSGAVQGITVVEVN